MAIISCNPTWRIGPLNTEEAVHFLQLVLFIINPDHVCSILRPQRRALRLEGVQRVEKYRLVGLVEDHKRVASTVQQPQLEGALRWTTGLEHTHDRQKIALANLNQKTHHRTIVMKLKLC